MAKIAIIDDDADKRGTVQGNIELVLAELNSSIEVVSLAPFKQMSEYFPFIQENEICVLILDEKLNDQAADEDGPVGYKGSQLIGTLREQLKEFPIFALTVIPKDEDLVAKYSLYEDIISRHDFYQQPEKYVPKFVRAGKNYLALSIDEKELSLFNDLVLKVSTGNTEPDIIEKFKALQVRIALPLSGFDDRTSWLNEYERQIKSLEELNEIIKSKIKK